jgi:hypothetical protein
LEPYHLLCLPLRRQTSEDCYHPRKAGSLHRPWGSAWIASRADSGTEFLTEFPASREADMVWGRDGGPADPIHTQLGDTTKLFFFLNTNFCSGVLLRLTKTECSPIASTPGHQSIHFGRCQGRRIGVGLWASWRSLRCCALPCWLAWGLP